MLAGVTVAARPPRKRVQALAPDERRAALIAATIPLLEQHGAAVSTRQIAEAAGVAEGTIFGVFPDKASLIQAAVVEAFRPEPAVEALARIAHIEDLRARLVAIVELISFGRSHRAPLLAVMRQLMEGRDGAIADILNRSRVEIHEAITAAIGPDRGQLRSSPHAVARMLLLMVFAGNAGGFGDTELITPQELVSLLLDGLLVRPDPTPFDPAQSENPGDSPC
jgi:AcrR family transcriptional regulator